MMSEPQFQSLNGAEWVLADGRDVSGSKYATLKGSSTIPDLRGIFRRGKNNGRSDGNQNPDGELALGAFQADQNLNHSHPYPTSQGVSSGGAATVPAVNGSGGSTSSGGSGGTEARPKSLTVNVFIKIN